MKIGSYVYNRRCRKYGLVVEKLRTPGWFVLLYEDAELEIAEHFLLEVINESR